VTTEPIPDAPSHPAELAHFAAAAVAAMALVPLLASTLSLGSEPGTEHWERWLFGLWLVLAGYLLAVAVTHLNEAWRGANRTPPALWLTLLRIATDLAVGSVVAWVLLRGPESRVLLSGLGDVLPGLLAAAAISVGISVYSRLREPVEPGEPRQSSRRGWFHVLIGLTLIAGLIVCETRPLPRIELATPAEAASA